jgi:5-methylcytosine-specific restriction endonuclease McrA
MCDGCRRAAQRLRPSAHSRGYTKQWSRFRRETFPSLLVAAGVVPGCGSRLPGIPSPHSACARDGVVNLDDALHLDHDPPLEDWERDEPSRVQDPERCGFLCARCHGAKTRGEQARGAV